MKLKMVWAGLHPSVMENLHCGSLKMTPRVSSTDGSHSPDFMTNTKRLESVTALDSWMIMKEKPSN